MLCPKCGADNQDGVHVCRVCQTPLYRELSGASLKPQITGLDNDHFLSAETPVKKFPWQRMVLAVVILLAVAGVAYGAYFAYDKYIANTPERVLAKSVATMKEIKASGFIFDLQIEADSSMAGDKATSSATTELLGSLVGTGKQKMYLAIDGYSDNTEANNIRTKAKIDLGLSVSGMTNTASAEMITLDKTLYFKINELPLMLAMFIDTSAIKNKWVKYTTDTATLEKFGAGDDEEMKKIRAILEEDLNKVIVIKNDLGTEDLAGNASYHYELALSKEETMKLIERLKAAAKDKELWEKALAEKTTGEQKNFDRFMDNFTFEVWVDKDDYYLRKVMVPLDKIGQSDEGKQETNGSLTVTLDKFNQVLPVEAPSDAMDLEKLLSEAMGGGMLGAFKQQSTSTELDVYTDTDDDGLDNWSETNVWKTDPEKADTDGDGYLDGDEVQHGYDPLVPGSARLK